MSQATERAFDAEIFAALKDAGLADVVTYRRQNGEVLSSINAEIDVNSDVFGDFESGAAEYRTAITLQRGDVGEPRRGDVIVDADGNNHEVQNIDEGGSDRSLVRVTAK